MLRNLIKILSDFHLQLPKHKTTNESKTYMYNQAATIIQSNWRGYVTRKKLKNINTSIKYFRVFVIIYYNYVFINLLKINK